jgi:energy-converting hydrogenase Eha subunit F
MTVSNGTHFLDKIGMPKKMIWVYSVIVSQILLLELNVENGYRRWDLC